MDQERPRRHSMRRIILFTACTCMLFFVAILLAGGNWVKSSDQEPIKRSPAQSTSSDAFNQHCTVFYASDGQIALGGNNEDSFNPRTKIWFLPPEEGKYGVAIVGYEDYNPQGAVNDHGVFFDGLAV